MYHNSNSVGTLSLLPCSMENGVFLTNVKWKIGNFHRLSFNFLFLSPEFVLHDPIKNEPSKIQFLLIKHLLSTIVTLEYWHDNKWKFYEDVSHPSTKREFDFTAHISNNFYYGSKTLVDDLRQHLASIQGETFAFGDEIHSIQDCSKEILLAFIDEEYNEDFIIECQGKEFKIKKIIIQARSPVFETMLSTNYFKEGQENRMTINDYGFEIVKKMIEFFQTDLVKNTIGYEFQLYEIARKYMCQSFMEFTRLPFIYSLTFGNFYDLLGIAQKHDDNKTLKLMNEWFSNQHRRR